MGRIAENIRASLRQPKRADGAVMQELVIYGGLLATRQEVYDDLRDRRSPDERRSCHAHCEQMAWMPRAATDAEVELLRGRGQTLARFRDWEAGQVSAA